MCDRTAEKPDERAAKVPFTDVQSNGLPSNSSAAAWISHARIGLPDISSTRMMVESTGGAEGGAVRGWRGSTTAVDSAPRTGTFETV